jgi:uroporphyrinogen decarboxylase
MTSRELVIKTLNHQPIPRAPRDLWIPSNEAAASMDDLAEMAVRFPSDITQPEVGPVYDKKSSGKSGKAGEVADPWGCLWKQGPEGQPVQVAPAPLSDQTRIAAYEPPAQLLDAARFSKVDKSCQATDRFVLAWSEVRPFDRMRALRGNDAALMDLARDTKNIRNLLAKLHDFACRELEMWAKTEVDGVAFRDDWASPEGLYIAPEMWRAIFRPLYRDYCNILHGKDKFVFFHSNGNISDIFGDLVKTGIDAIHSQLYLMDLERLSRRYRNRVTFWGGGDHQRLCDPGPIGEFRQSVLAIRKALDFGSGGVIAQCQWGPGVRVQTMAAFFEQWLTQLPMHG